ncbi:hypothetical protein HanRHA438_Chr01g0001701 [Helianthus annuus]|nr:hypothetical protein HanIR_Chr01g0001881 [Helianthus annuus]KAJ0946228.1 hypothetical protein HanRHA438_Chr01g0001701 [Helianthus annuus]
MKRVCKHFYQGKILASSFNFIKRHIVIFTVSRVITLFISIKYSNRDLSLDRICDYGHITHWLTRCPVVKFIK